MDSYQFDNLLKETVGDLWRNWNYIHCSIPPKLFHYTNNLGLDGIFCQNKIRATNLNNFEDKHEFVYACDLILDILENRLLNACSDISYTLLYCLKDNFNWYKYNQKVYAVCFCASMDSKYHWGKYADDWNGYALGFSGQHLKYLTVNGYDFTLNLKRIIYDVALQKKLIQFVIDSSCCLIEQKIEDYTCNDDYLQKITNLCLQVAPLLYDYMYCFKKCCYEKDQEWRLIYKAPEDGQCSNYSEYIMPANHIRPIGKLPVSLIKIGSKIYSEAEILRLNSFLKDKGYSELTKIQ